MTRTSLTIWIYLRYDKDVTKDDGCIKIKSPDGLEKEHIV